MRAWGRRTLLAGVAVLVGAQVVPVPRVNPSVDLGQTISATIAVPPEIAGILGRACQDCHSSQTVWPWYSRVAPVSWFLVHHVNEGRRELNLSDWGRYAPRRQDRKLKEICEQVSDGKMPLPTYTLMHPQAKLNAQETKALCEWASAARRNLAMNAAIPSAR